jgi:hypothetical protein
MRKPKYDRTMEKRMATFTDLLCCGFPNEFGIFLNYCCALCFENTPDSSCLRKLSHDPFVCERNLYYSISLIHFSELCLL